MDQQEMNKTGRGGGMTMMMMDMGGMHEYFWVDFKVPNLLFEGFNITTVLGLSFLCVGLGVVALLLEGLRVLREHLREKVEQRTFHVTKRHPDRLPEVRKQNIYLHAMQATLHLIQTVVAYLLMLVVMTFNVWMSVAVVAGAGLGYLLFGFLRSPKPFARMACLQQSQREGSPAVAGTSEGGTLSSSISPSSSTSGSANTSMEARGRSKSPSPIPPHISCSGGRENGAYQQEDTEMRCCSKPKK